MIFPFGIDPKTKHLVEALDKTQKAQNKVPPSTCKHRACCCKAGCPNMHLTEYLAIRRGYIDALDKEEYLDLLMQCIEYYLTRQYEGEGEDKTVTEKPCPLLGSDNGCKAYSWRPLKCRTYGQIPRAMYTRIVDEVSKESGIKKAQIPLCVQCPYVKTQKGATKLTEELIASLEERIRKSDNSIGVSKGFQKLGYSFLTFHDWHIMCELGEAWMERLTPLRQQTSKEWRDMFLKDLREALSRREFGGSHLDS